MVKAIYALAALALLIVSAGTAAITAAVTTSAASGTASSPNGTRVVDGVTITGFPSGGRNPGIFTDTCAPTLTAPDDPIMMPGMTGMSMQHNFFGNLSPTASSVPAQLVGGKSSCTTSADASAYWLPVVYQNGRPLTPSKVLIYWRSPAASATSVKTMPAGISMIAGNEAATAPQSSRIVDWTCTSLTGINQKASNAPHDCGPGRSLRLVIVFPNCWDGRTLDGKSQQNVVYHDRTGSCPASHPVQIPQIVLHVSYPTASGANLTLSTGPRTQGPPVTGHADFMNGWTQSTLDRDVTACIDTQTRCGAVFGTAATPRGGREREPRSRSTF